MGHDCDYQRGTDRIVITEEELIGLCVREKNGRDCDYGRGTDYCDYDRGTDGIVIRA